MQTTTPTQRASSFEWPRLFEHARAFAFANLLATLACSPGCTAEASEMRTLESGDQGLAYADETERGQWQSAPWNGRPWLHLRANTALRIAHPLGYTPAVVLPYIAFAQDDDGRNGNATLAAGTVAEIVDVDDEFVTIENRTQADFYLRVVLH